MQGGRASPRSRRSRVRAASISRRSIPRVVKAETFTRRARGKSTGRVRAAGTGGDAPQERRDVHRGERVGPRAAGLRADGLVRGRFHGHHGGGGELCASLCGRYWGNVVLGPLCRRGDKAKPPAPRADESSLIRVVKKVQLLNFSRHRRRAAVPSRCSPRPSPPRAPRASQRDRHRDRAPLRVAPGSPHAPKDARTRDTGSPTPP